jgi:2-polyprenyl-3-methyl-5-hydroxy-6-metoxy-1,4-benzoquinol methylase
MVERAAAKGRSVVAGAADEHLAALEADSLGAVFSAQVVEHLTHEELAGFLELARERLRPGGMLIAETLNPHVPEALRNFWSDPTHVRPIFPETLLSLCLLAGYGSAYVFHPDASGDPEADLLSRPVYAVVASA